MATAYECRRSYLDVMLAQAAVDAARASLERLGIIARDVNHFFASGLADSVDVYEAALALERGREALSGARTLYRVALERLASMTGIESQEEIYPTEGLASPRPAALPETASIESRRPELEQLAHVERAATHATALSRSDYLPEIYAFGTYSVGRPNQDMFNNEWNDYLMAGVSLRWDYNLAGRTPKSVAAERRRAMAGEEARLALDEDLRLQSRTSLLRARRAYEAMLSTAEQLALARNRFRLASKRQQAGTLSLNHLLEMEADLTSLEEHYTASVVEYYLAETDYLYAVGSPRLFGGLQ